MHIKFDSDLPLALLANGHCYQARETQDTKIHHDLFTKRFLSHSHSTALYALSMRKLDRTLT